MNLKMEVIEGALISIVSTVSRAIASSSRYGGPAIVATIPYEEVDQQ
jgi:hypothetical protein